MTLATPGKADLSTAHQQLTMAGLTPYKCANCPFTCFIRIDHAVTLMPQHSCAYYLNHPRAIPRNNEGNTMAKKAAPAEPTAGALSAEARATLATLYAAIGEALGIGASAVATTAAPADDADIMGILDGAGTAAAPTADEDDPVAAAMAGAKPAAPAPPAAPTHADLKKAYNALLKRNKPKADALIAALQKTVPGLTKLTDVPPAELVKWITWADKQVAA